MTTPTNLPTTNEAAATVNSIIQSAIYNFGVNAAYADAVAAYPFLALPIISQLFTMVLDWFAGLIYKYLAQCATFTVINIQTQQELDTYNSASAAVTAAVSSGDPSAIATATANFNAALAKLIHFDGSAKIQFKRRFSYGLTVQKPFHTVHLDSRGRVFKLRNRVS